MKDVRNRTREEIEKLLAKTPRSAIYDLIYSLATCEPHFSVAELAQRWGKKKHTVLGWIKKGVLFPVYVTTDRADYDIPLSAIRDFERRTTVDGQLRELWLEFLAAREPERFKAVA